MLILVSNWPSNYILGEHLRHEKRHKLVVVRFWRSTNYCKNCVITTYIYCQNVQQKLQKWQKCTKNGQKKSKIGNKFQKILKNDQHLWKNSKIAAISSKFAAGSSCVPTPFFMNGCGCNKVPVTFPTAALRTAVSKTWWAAYSSPPV